ncbi:MAG: hypothetical protein [Olavius algarvensis Gamma 1 endosymbiont]|nr:MAG: hypothetical protein [Olavius algarvensis Gamma 1 endosymbiont]
MKKNIFYQMVRSFLGEISTEPRKNPIRVIRRPVPLPSWLRVFV